MPPVPRKGGRERRDAPLPRKGAGGGGRNVLYRGKGRKGRDASLPRKGRWWGGRGDMPLYQGKGEARCPSTEERGWRGKMPPVLKKGGVRGKVLFPLNQLK